MLHLVSSLWNEKELEEGMDKANEQVLRTNLGMSFFQRSTWKQHDPVIILTKLSRRAFISGAKLTARADPMIKTTMSMTWMAKKGKINPGLRCKGIKPWLV